LYLLADSFEIPAAHCLHVLIFYLIFLSSSLKIMEENLNLWQARFFSKTSLLIIL